MAGIQASINQGLSIAGFLFSQTEFAKTQQETRRLDKAYEGLNKAYSNYARDTEGREYQEGEFNPTAAEALKYAEKKMDVVERLESLKPDKYIGLAEEAGADLYISQENKAFADKAEAERAQARADEEAEYARHAEEDKAIMAQKEADKKAGEEASQTIRSAIKDPFAIADAELQKAIQTKQEINKRKGGIMR